MSLSVLVRNVVACVIGDLSFLGMGCVWHIELGISRVQPVNVHLWL